MTDKKNKTQKIQEYPEEAMELLNKYFPTGDKKRGEARALMATYYHKIKNNIKMCILDILYLHGISIKEAIARIKEI